MPKKRVTAAEVDEARKSSYSATKRRYYLRNREARIAAATAYNAGSGAESAKKAKKKWFAANRDKANGYEGKRRARIAAAKWGNPEGIESLYALAKTMGKLLGEPYHIDHIYPLKGRTVCGLHVEANLQVISKAENMKKGNRMPHLAKETC